MSCLFLKRNRKAEISVLKYEKHAPTAKNVNENSLLRRLIKTLRSFQPATTIFFLWDHHYTFLWKKKLKISQHFRQIQHVWNFGEKPLQGSFGRILLFSFPTLGRSRGWYIISMQIQSSQWGAFSGTCSNDKHVYSVFFEI